MRISDWSSDVCSSDLGPFGSDLTATGRKGAMRRLRLLAAAFAAVVVLVLVAVVYLATLDLNAYKGEIQAAIQDAIGRPVEIEGPLRLAWSPTPSVDASEIRIANADWGSEPDMATVGRLRAHIDPGALRRGGGTGRA